MTVEFSPEEFDLIQDYQKEIEAVSIKVAILHAVCMGLDHVDDDINNGVMAKMKIDKVIKLLKAEKECVKRNSEGCNKDCSHCDLAQEDHELIEMYDFVLAMMQIFKKRLT